MGTVTGRILVVSPGVQYLKKTSRSIFAPEEDCSFLYADFDQFEPGIIASLSKDLTLIDIYNNGDVYIKLSELLFGTSGERKLAKTLFLSYMYGMGREKLLNLIEKVGGVHAKNQASSFFSLFGILEDWKETLLKNAKKDGFVSSIMGNSRYTAREGSLTRDEERWIPAQIVQGTASLIFKRAIIKLKQEADFVRFLVPMHDAILVQVPSDQQVSAREMIERIFCTTFQCFCPRISPNISFEQFDRT